MDTTTAFDNIDNWVALSSDGLIGEIFGLLEKLSGLAGNIDSLLGLL
ncbi:PorA family porin [Corynebacterium camporealensis]